jgi:hypothetical protein
MSTPAVFLPPRPQRVHHDEVLEEITTPEGHLIFAQPLELKRGERIQFALLRGNGAILGVAVFPPRRRS